MMMLALYGALQQLYDNYAATRMHLQSVVDDVRLHITGAPALPPIVRYARRSRRAQSSTATSLGHAVHLTRRRRTAKVQSRSKLAFSKLQKVRMLRRAGARTQCLTRAGPVASANWGSAVLGLPG
eukprot:4927998-Amphidinium_carterae.5